MNLDQILDTLHLSEGQSAGFEHLLMGSEHLPPGSEHLGLEHGRDLLQLDGRLEQRAPGKPNRPKQTYHTKANA